MSGTTERIVDDERGVPSPRLEEISNVLLLSPSLGEPARRACHDLMTLAPPEEQDLIYLTFTRADANHVDPWRTGDDGGPGSVLVIDAAPHERATDPIGRESVSVESVSSPSNTTEIGIALSKHVPDLERSDRRTVVCARSLTAFLQYVDLKQAYKFLNVLTNQLASIDAFSHFHLDPSAHDEKVVTTLSTLFDAVLEIDDSGTLQADE